MLDTKVLHVLAWLVALILFAGLAAFQVSNGILYIDGYSGDSLFILDVLARIAAGQVPHVDFTLHLGALPFGLIHLFDGGALGKAYIIGQITFTALALLGAYWVGRTRLNALAMGVLTVSVVILGTSLSTEVRPEVSLALFYNRWAWVLGLLFATAAFLDRNDAGYSLWDGVVLGVLAFALLTTKITFFVALVPLAVLRFAVTGRFRQIASGAVAFVLCAFAIAAVWGPQFWSAYQENLVWVATNPIRGNTGKDLTAVLSERDLLPFLIAIAVFLAAVVAFRGAKAGAMMASVMLAFLFVQYQNFGNVPFWILFLAIASFAYSAEHNGQRSKVWIIFGCVFFGLAVAPLAPLAKSTFTNADAAQSRRFQPLYPDDPRFDGIEYLSISFAPVEAIDVELLSPLHPLASPCRLVEGFVGVYQSNGALMASLGGPALVLDTPSPEWLFSGGRPLLNAAAWNYGSLRGISDAVAVIIPTCATKPAYQAEMLKEIDRLGFVLSETGRTAHGILYEVSSVSD